MRHYQGFSLIELMVTITILAILIAIAGPSFTSSIRESRIATLSSELQGALQLARSEAVKRRVNVVICRRNDAGTACENGVDWGNGWLVQQTGGDVIKVWDSVQGMTITGPNAGTTFRSNGMASASSFAVTHSGCTDQQKRDLSVSATGTTTLEKVGC